MRHICRGSGKRDKATRKEGGLGGERGANAQWKGRTESLEGLADDDQLGGTKKE